MINLGLRPSQFIELKNLLVTNHRLRVTLQLLTLNHEYMGDISDRLLGGQVSIDEDGQDGTRVLTVDLLDLDHELQIDADAPEDGSMYATRMIKVVYSVGAPTGGVWYDIPVFCGPLHGVQRNGPVITLTAVGKEKLSMGAVWKGGSFKKNTPKTDIIRYILREYSGETKMDIVAPKSNPRIGAKMSFNREDTAWSMCQRLAKSMSQQLFYDGRGVCRMRPYPSGLAHTFTDEKALLSNPQVGYDMSTAVNAVEVIGKTKGKGKKKAKNFSFRLVAPSAHPLSPNTLGRRIVVTTDGISQTKLVPRYLPETIQDDSIKSVAEARAIASQRLAALLIQQAEVSFDSLAIPFLEEGDLCRAIGDDFIGNFRVKQMTIPLTADGISTMGYLKRVTPRKRVIRSRGRMKTR